MAMHAIKPSPLAIYRAIFLTKDVLKVTTIRVESIHAHCLLQNSYHFLQNSDKLKMS